MQYADHRQEVRHRDYYYAQAQMAMHRARPRSSICVVDPAKRCARAWRCGFAEKVDGCASFIPRSGCRSSSSMAATSCKYCARKDKADCGWRCMREVAPRDGAKQNQLPA